MQCNKRLLYRLLGVSSLDSGRLLWGGLLFAQAQENSTPPKGIYQRAQEVLSLVRLLVGCLDAGRSAAVTTGPRSSQSAAGLVMGSRNRLGLRRSLLAQEDAQDDQDAHREELRLPVLERLIPEIRLLQMLEDGLGRLLMPRASSLASLVLPTAWSPNDSRNRLNSALHSELEYSHRTAPPRRTSITPKPRKSQIF